MDEKPTYRELEKRVQRLEQALQKGEKKYRILLDESSDPIFSFYPDGTYSFVNQAFAEGVGKPVDQIVGHTIWDIFPGEEGDKRFSVVKHVFATGEPKIIEVRVPRPEGDQYYITTVKAAKDNHGQVNSVTCISKNITDRKQTEEKLRESEERHRLFFENAPIGIIHYSNKGIITAVNEAVVATFGSSREQLIGLDIEEIPDKTFAEEVYKSLNGQPGYYEGEYSSFTGKKTSHIKAIWIPIKQKGEILAGVGIVEDITTAQRTEAELLKMEKLKSLGVLAGGIAHDFNNFLSGIIGNLSLVQLDIDPSSRIYPRLNEMEKAAMRARELTQQLLTFSKGGEPVKRLAQMDTLVREAALFALGGSNIRCQFDFPDDFWPAHVDAGQIGQVIHNLAINADQVMPEGGVVAISGKHAEVGPGSHLSLSPGKYIQIMVQDLGTGIREEHIDKIFDPYFTTKQKGSGLGLTIVYSIIEKHGGQVTVCSKLGEGATFNIYLPASHASTMKTATPKEAIAFGSGRILIMDDENFIRTLASEMLKKMGYETALARDGAEAIKLYRHAMASDEPFDAVILDLTVPGGMGAWEAITKLYDIDKHVKAIVSSGYSNDPVMSNYRDYGFLYAVKKPYVIKELSDALKKVELLP